MSLLDSSVRQLSRLFRACLACKFVRVHPFSWPVILSCVLENVRKAAAMHNSVKKYFLKTRSHEGESPSISPQVTVRLFSSTREPVHSVKPGTQAYCQDDYECHLSSVCVFKVVWCAVSKEFKTSCCQSSSQRLAYFFKGVIGCPFSTNWYDSSGS